MTMTMLANAQIITETDQIHGAVSFDGMDIVAVDKRTVQCQQAPSIAKVTILPPPC